MVEGGFEQPSEDTGGAFAEVQLTHDEEAARPSSDCLIVLTLLQQTWGLVGTAKGSPALVQG